MSRIANTIPCGNTPTFPHDVYYCIHVKTFGQWGHQDKLLKCLYALKLELIDFRIFNNTPYIEDVIYVKDSDLSLPPTTQLNKKDHLKLSKRFIYIKNSFKASLQDRNAQIDVIRWNEMENISHPPNTDKTQEPISYIKHETYKYTRSQITNMELLRQHGIEPLHNDEYWTNIDQIHGVYSDESMPVLNDHEHEDDANDNNLNVLICSDRYCRITSSIQCQRCKKYVCQTHTSIIESRESMVFCRKCGKKYNKPICSKGKIAKIAVVVLAAASFIMILL